MKSRTRALLPGQAEWHNAGSAVLLAGVLGLCMHQTSPVMRNAEC